MSGVAEFGARIALTCGVAGATVLHQQRTRSGIASASCRSASGVAACRPWSRYARGERDVGRSRQRLHRHHGCVPLTSGGRIPSRQIAQQRQPPLTDDRSVVSVTMQNTPPTVQFPRVPARTKRRSRFPLKIRDARARTGDRVPRTLRPSAPRPRANQAANDSRSRSRPRGLDGRVRQGAWRQTPDGTRRCTER